MSTWILLRGLTRECRHWGAFPDLLKAALPNERIALIDLPGSGALNLVNSPTSMAAIASHCRSEAKRLQLSPPYYLLAVSLGAMAAIAWTEARPEEVAGCVLINTSLRGLSPLHHRLRPSACVPLIRLVLAHDARVQEQIILRLTSSRPQDFPDILDAWVALRNDRPVSSGNAFRQLVAAMAYRPPSKPPCQPTLVLASAGDALVNPDCSRRLAATWNTDYAEHPDAGHDLTLDDGPWAVLQIERWMDQCAVAIDGKPRSAGCSAYHHD